MFRLNSKSPHGVDSVYELGLGEKRIFTVPMDSVMTSTCARARMARAPGSTCALALATIDVKRVLRHLDPLFADADIKTLKNPSHPKRVAELLEAIGVVNQCTTSYVTKITSYGGRQVRPHAAPGREGGCARLRPPTDLEWLHPVAYVGSATAKNGKTTRTSRTTRTIRT